MKLSLRISIGVVLLALALGLTGTWLLQGGAVGIGDALWGLLALGAAVLVGLRGGSPVPVAVRWLALPMAFLLFCLAWRDSSSLATANGIALLLLAGAALRRVHGGSLVEAGAWEASVGLGRAWASSLGAGIRVAAEAVRPPPSSEPDAPGTGEKGDAVAPSSASRDSLALVRALVLLVPLLLVFGALLASADPGFGRALGRFFSGRFFDMSGARLSDVLLVAGLGWVSAGMLWQVARRPAAASRPALLSRAWNFGPTEVLLVLGTLNALFAVFALAQFARIGSDGSAADLLPSRFARSGFFHLVTVVGIAVPVMLVVHWALRRDDVRAAGRFRVQATIMIGLLAVFLGLSVVRVTLYVAAFGLSEGRLYGLVACAWLAFSLAWLAWTVLRGRRERFAPGALAGALVLLAVMNVANPDAVIVRVNTSRPRMSEPRDVAYLVRSLDGDAVGPLIEALPTLEPDERKKAALLLEQRWTDAPRDWRGLTIGRVGAMAAVEENLPALRTLAAPR